jgi:hypothetical protein
MGPASSTQDELVIGVAGFFNNLGKIVANYDNMALKY